ncbi:hypothetical protein L2E82_45223 [Cichorium intybus]|uniref:Uncharacterized protein n=1 Tax=Cichorium intybus TaxID=13427 RepID=A0ACB8ZSQ8_CICIN|nr:hypothetical protein L2E82_45223 [Cichorium intybus]
MLSEINMVDLDSGLVFSQLIQVGQLIHVHATDELGQKLCSPCISRFFLSAANTVPKEIEDEIGLVNLTLIDLPGLTKAAVVGVLNSIKSSWQNVPPNWTGLDPCASNWDGIDYTNSRVTSLDLSNNKGIKAPFPTSIQNLMNLTIFANKLQGLIPVSNGTTTPRLDNLKMATDFHLSDNWLSGDIRSDLLILDMNLIYVIFNNNKLSGTIPLKKGFLGTLQEPLLDSNSLTGRVPQNIIGLKSVSSL